MPGCCQHKRGVHVRDSLPTLALTSGPPAATTGTPLSTTSSTRVTRAPDSRGLLWGSWCPTTRQFTLKCARDICASSQRQKRRGRAADQLLLHTAYITSSALRLQLEALGHKTVLYPPYFSVVSPSGYYFSQASKNFLKQKPFNAFNELKSAAELFFESQPPASGAGNGNLSERRSTMIEIHGEYIDG
ncbi:hypothetical protein RB195_017695 [Necator americanus]|uniref:Uncharacterized protein n=1 Tax=Necator americanus TaxID=51031 RepID=A0ABR1C8G4_NECAM